MSVEGRRPQHKCDGDSHNGSAADSDSARGSSILSSPTTPQQPSCCGFSLRGVALLVARLVRDQEARGSNPRTPTMQSVLMGSEYPVMDTLHFYFPQSSYRKAFRGVAECCAFSCFRDHVGRPDFPAARSASRGPKQTVPRSAQSAAAGYGCDDYFFSCSLRSCSSSWRLVRRRS